MTSFLRTLSTAVLVVLLPLSIAACGGDGSGDAAPSSDAHTHEDGSTHSHGENGHSHEHADTSQTRLDTSGMDGEMHDSTSTDGMHEGEDDDEKDTHSHDDGTHSHGGSEHSHE